MTDAAYIAACQLIQNFMFYRRRGTMTEYEMLAYESACNVVMAYNTCAAAMLETHAQVIERQRAAANGKDGAA